MNHIGKVIKELRLKHKLTQKELAARLSVSVAAISKWETGSANPDIDLLPKIALLFKISIDYLFSYSIDINESLDDLKSQAESVFNMGEQKKAIRLINELITRYPNDTSLMLSRAKMTTYVGSAPPIDSDKKNLLKISINDLNYIVECSSKREEVDESYYLMSMAYVNLKDFDKAIKAIEYIHQSPFINTGIALLRIHLDSGNLSKAQKRFEMNLYQCLGTIHGNSVWIDDLYDNDQSKLKFYNLALDIFRAFSGEDSSRIDLYLSSFYEKTAAIKARNSWIESALEDLRKAVDYANSYDKLEETCRLSIFESLNSTEQKWGRVVRQRKRLFKQIESKLNGDYLNISKSPQLEAILKELANSIS